VSTVPPIAPQISDRRQAVRALALAAMVIAAFAAAWWTLDPTWRMNPDGSRYLVVAQSFRLGRGLTLPDGTLLLTRPVYPLLLAFTGVNGPSIDVAIWITRLAVAGGALIVAGLVYRQTLDTWATITAGALAFVQPWTVTTGTRTLVADGLMATLTVAAVALAVGARNRAGRAALGWYAAALSLGVVAAFTKETGVTALAAVGILSLHQRRPRLALIALPLATVGLFIALVIANGWTPLPVGDIASTMYRSALSQAFQNPVLLIVGVATITAATVWGTRNARDPLSFAGLTLIALGLAPALYALSWGWNLRNGAVLPLGVALIAGAVIHQLQPQPQRVRAVAGVLVLALLAANFWSGYAAASDATNEGWETPSTRAASAWLLDNARNKPVDCTFSFCSQIAFNTKQAVALDLVPSFSAPPGATTANELQFDERSTWWTWEPYQGPNPDKLIGLNRIRERYVGYFEGPLLDQLRARRSQYVVVSGTAGNRPFDGTVLLPYFESNPAFRRAFTTRGTDPSDWIAIYEVVGPLAPRTVKPTLSRVAAAAFTDRSSLGKVRVLNTRPRNELLNSVLGPPPTP